MKSTSSPVLIPTILCGGAGSRLWPVSREEHPKPFIRLDDGHSLLQHAFLRGAALPNVSEVMTVTNRELLFKAEDEFDEIKDLVGRDLDTRFILEPFARNTAAAVATASLQIAADHGEEALILVLAADHLIADQVSFASAVDEACVLAQQGKLVTFGIRPKSAETGYGYIQAKGNAVCQFVEKPDLPTAQSYLDSGDFLWNSGMFCFQAGAMLRELETHSPEVLATAKVCLKQARRADGEGFSQIELNRDDFALVPDNSIDYAVMEKTMNAAVVPCDIGWSDIGCWRALGELAAPDEQNNRISGEVLIEDTENCIIKSDCRLIGAVGIDGLVIIDTPDALLVADKRRVQEVKQIFGQLKALNHDTHRLHRTVYRPWGEYTVLEEDEYFKIKRITVKVGASLSLQLHHHRCEHWVVVSGDATVVNGDQTLQLTANQSTYIPAEHKHRLSNNGTTPLVIIEVQTGDYLGEDDIVRFQDVYGRVEA